MCARSLRSTLETLSAHSCGLKTMVEVLVCDSVHKNLEVKVLHACYLYMDLFRDMMFTFFFPTRLTVHTLGGNWFH